MRHGAAHFERASDALVDEFRLPLGLLADALGEVVLHAELELGPKLHEREVRVEVHVVRVVHAVLVAFEVGEAAVFGH